MIVCRQCGQSAREGEDFCESCGAFLEWEGEKVDPAPTSAPTSGGATGSGTPAAPAAPRHGEPVPEPDRWVTPEPPPPTAPGGGMGPPSGPAPNLQTRPAGQGTTGSDVTCLECGGRNAADRRFCRRCGASLELVALARPSLASPVEPPPVAGPATTGPMARAPGSAVPDAPRVVARGPAVPEAPKVVPRAPAAPATRPGAQPAEQQARPPAVRPEARPAAVEPGGALCAQCGTANPPGRHFCRKCGAALTVAGRELEPGLVAAPRPSFWQRLKARFRRGGDKENEAQPSRTARTAYRRTLDVRYRIYRVLAVVGGVGLLAGSLGLAGYSPISGARGLWNRFFPRYEQVDQLEAVSNPADREDPEFGAGAAVDKDPTTEWAAVWLLPPGADPIEECLGEDAPGGADQMLVVSLPEPTKITKVSLQAGLAEGDPDRAGQFSPTRVELLYDNGECDQIDLDDKAGFQDHRLSAPETTTLRIRVLAATPPTDEALSQGKVGLGEVRIYRAG